MRTKPSPSLMFSVRSESGHCSSAANPEIVFDNQYTMPNSNGLDPDLSAADLIDETDDEMTEIELVDGPETATIPAARIVGSGRIGKAPPRDKPRSAPAKTILERVQHFLHNRAFRWASRIAIGGVLLYLAYLAIDLRTQKNQVVKANQLQDEKIAVLTSSRDEAVRKLSNADPVLGAGILEEVQGSEARAALKRDMITAYDFMIQNAPNDRKADQYRSIRKKIETSLPK